MNFQEICELVAEEVNGRPLTFSSVALAGTGAETDPFKRKVIRAVQSVNMSVLLFSRNWKFLNKRGELLSITSGRREYTLPCIQSIDWGSLYLTQSGTNGRFPVYEEAYPVWQTREKTEPGTTGVPLRMILSDVPDKWIFWPTPNNDYVLNGNLQWKPTQLEALDDEPMWDSVYHELLVWLAVKHLESRVKTQDEIVSGLNASEAQRNSSMLFHAFCNQYLPQIIGAIEA